MIGKELEKIIDGGNIIKSFFEEQEISNKLRLILDEFAEILKDNNENNNKELNLEEMDYEKYYNEIISVNGIQTIYKNNEDQDNKENEIIEEEKNNEDKGEDLSNGKYNEDDKNTKDKNNEDDFKIDFIIQEIKDNMKYSIVLINLKLYYKYFSTILNKIFRNAGLKLLSKIVVDDEKK